MSPAQDPILCSLLATEQTTQQGHHQSQMYTQTRVHLCDFQNAIGAPVHTIQPVIAAVRGVSFGLVLDVLCRHRCRVNVRWASVAFRRFGKFLREI